jgi:adenylate cyclase
MKLLQLNKFKLFILCSLVYAGFLLVFGPLALFNRLDQQLSNYLYLQPEKSPSEDIVLIAIDDKSLELREASEIGTLQFAKADYANVIQKLADAGVSTIGLDIILSEASGDEDVKKLTDVLSDNSMVIIAGQPNGLKPLQAIQDVAEEQIASVVFVPDDDTVVRRQAVTTEDNDLPTTFALKIASTFLGKEGGHIENQSYIVSDETIRVGGKKYAPIQIPLTNENEFLLNFFGRPNSYQSISMADVLKGDFVNRDSGEVIDLKNKIVLIGEIGTAIHDVQRVPVSFGVVMPGVEIHANAIQTILEQSFLQEQSNNAVLFLSFILFLISLSLYAFFKLRWSLLIAGGLLGAYLISTWLAFSSGLVLNSVFPYISILVALLVSYLYRYFVEEKKGRQTIKAFGQYVSPHVVQELLQDPSKLQLGGEKKMLTIFFSDIAGFTSISEKLTPEELVVQLNEYLDEMSDTIHRVDGTIDKYIGDAIMAIWNAPLNQKEHAFLACKGALGCVKQLAVLNERRKERGDDPLGARIGLNTGEVVVGNMGSTTRFDYTVIGDSVNLASRLEAVNKVYGTDVMISETTYAFVKERVVARELDLITVKGKEQPVRIYELIALKEDETKANLQLITRFEEALILYRKKAWNEAINAFKQLLSQFPDDGPSKLFLARCKELQGKNDLPGDWDGVFKLTSK